MTRLILLALALAACDEGPPFDDDALRAGDFDERAVVERLNALRASAGLAPVVASPELHLSVGRHARYVLWNRDRFSPEAPLSAHDEYPWWPGYTAANGWERAWAAGFRAGAAKGEVIHFLGDGRRALDGWLNSIYHRVDMLAPDTTHVGHVSLRDGDGAVDAMQFGFSYGAQPDAVVQWPPPGAVNVSLAFDGFEVPRPRAPPAGFPSASPISLVFSTFRFSRLVVKASSVTVDGVAVPHVVLDDDTDAFLHDAIFLYPYAPFPPGADVEVDVSFEADGTAMSRRWRFGTCARVDPDAPLRCLE